MKWVPYFHVCHTKSTFSSLSFTVCPHPTQTHTSLQDLLLLWTCICPIISFLKTLLLLWLRTAPWAAAVKLKLQLFNSFLLRNATQYRLLPLLKLTIYLLPSPPNHLIYIAKVRLFCFQFNLFSHASSFHLIFTSDSSSLTPMAKTGLHC